MRYQHLRFPNGKAKAVTLSYDDGCRSDLKMSETIDRYGLKCTFNLNSTEHCGKGALTKEEVERYFLSKGHEIAVHGYFHRAEGALRPIEGIREVLDCRLELERRYGLIIRGMAYPDSGIKRMLADTDYETIKRYLTDLDIAYARTLGQDNQNFQLPQDWHCWVPTAHHENSKLFDYIDTFLNLDLSVKTYCDYRYPRLFYLWGHSFEFERNQNWERLTEICERLGNREDIWYATNMEIYEYVHAYRSLVYSADGRIIYNPTLIQLWFDIDGTMYSIQPGQTLKL